MKTHKLTPRLRDTGRYNPARIVLQVSEADSNKVQRGLNWEAVVTDIPSGNVYVLRGAACSLSSCVCDAVVVDGPLRP